jgi:hypothetical protein
MFRTKNFSKFVNAGRESLFDSRIVDFVKFVIERLKASPLIHSEDIDEGREVKGSVVTDVFVCTCFSRVDVEIDNLLVNI